MKPSKPKLDPAGASSPLGHNPFAALKGKLSELPEGPPPTKTAVLERPLPARAVVRMERSGRGGKEVTCIEQLGLEPKEMERWLKELKNQLGCGGTIEGDRLVLQGDQRPRIKELLTSRGVRRISIG